MRQRNRFPDGLSARFTLMILLALLLSHALAAAIIMSVQAGIERGNRTEFYADRLAAYAAMLSQTPPELQAEVAAGGNTRLLRMSVDPRPMLNPPAGSTSEIFRALKGRLPGHDIAATANPDGETDELEAISIRITVSPERWLNASILPGAASSFNQIPIHILGIFIISFIVTSFIGILFVRQISRPLHELAEAAELAGAGNHTVRVSERVPSEIRAANRAFNVMQSRIAGFDEERMRQLAAVGHDLRTPITGLRINCEMVEDEETRAEMIGALEVMTVIADELTLFGQGNKLSEPIETADLEQLLGRVARSRSISLNSSGAALCELRPVAILRAVNNLIDNAIKYAAPPMIHLDHRSGGFRIRVEDDGPGLPDEMLISALEPFTRGENSRNAQTGGVGLGLAIARGIAAMHGGTLRLVNRDQGGLSAQIEIPVQQAS